MGITRNNSKSDKEFYKDISKGYLMIELMTKNDGKKVFDKPEN